MVRFDQPCRRVSSALEYFKVHMAKQDYLTQQGQVEMLWAGKGAERLGLKGMVDAEHFERLCRGKHPETGEKLTMRDKGKKRRVCYFAQISVPKDVSIALLVAGDKRIEDWWKETIQETMAEIEAVTSTRIRKGGAWDNRTTGNFIAGVVTHDTSRRLDPQLHTHLCIMNVTFDEVEKRWKGIEPTNFYRYQSYFREVSYNKLAERMKDAGYKLERARKIGFTIKGFPPELRKIFSKRRDEIESMAAVLGTKNQDALQSIAVKTRPGKEQISGELLKSHWQTEAVPLRPKQRKSSHRRMG